MKKNMGALDRVLRIIGGAALVLIAIFAVESTVWTVILLVIGIIMLVTSVIGSCPAYIPLGVDTGKKKE